MLTVIKPIFKGLMVLSLIFVAVAAVAQVQPAYQLNKQDVNQRTGVALLKLMQEEHIVLSLDEKMELSNFDSLTIYLVRENRPLASQRHVLSGVNALDITALMKNAKAADRLVLELDPKDKKDNLLSVISFY